MTGCWRRVEGLSSDIDTGVTELPIDDATFIVLYLLGVFV